MRPLLFVCVWLNIFCGTLQARLGETLDQAISHYGMPKTFNPNHASTLLQGANEACFEVQGWKIRCALLLAADGREYIVREQYTKTWNVAVMKAGGSPSIADYEVEAVLQGEAGAQKWQRKLLGKADQTLSGTIANQLAHSAGVVGTIWIRPDGAELCVDLGHTSIRLDLPQAVKYEAELKAIKDAQARASVPKF